MRNASTDGCRIGLRVSGFKSMVPMRSVGRITIDNGSSSVARRNLAILIFLFQFLSQRLQQTALIQGPQGQLPSTRPRGAAAGGHSTLSCEDARVANAVAAGFVCVFVKRRELPG